MRKILGFAAVCVIAACSSANQTFTLTSASVDSTYLCPGGTNNAPYDLHATIQVHNGTSKEVTITAVTAQMTLASVKGAWLEKIGDRYDAGNAKFMPATVPAGADAALKVTIASACTNGKPATGTSSSGDYKVTIHLATSAGNFSITAGNQHEIVAA